MSADLTKLTLTSALSGLGSGAFSSRELTDAFLDAIEAANPALNAYVLVTGDKARAMADAADARRKRG
ncbi:MAG: Asp-tRNA(Asn)/Glu-tRNA(Gln) amidotransferase GatCAB subunit A, partial [Alphaproteobacteria bacterium]|nr:Asp-tRNA(Asn)/Glu-tRNA(Gln) amidotransferase GatCAB subunit A [Alphaproteobacteria bacterium]